MSDYAQQTRQIVLERDKTTDKRFNDVGERLHKVECENAQLRNLLADMNQKVAVLMLMNNGPTAH